MLAEVVRNALLRGSKGVHVSQCIPAMYVRLGHGVVREQLDVEE